MRRFGFGPGAQVVAALLAIIVVAVVAAPLYAPQNPFNIASLRLLDSLDPPSFLHGGVKDSRSAPMPRGATCCRRSCTGRG